MGASVLLVPVIAAVLERAENASKNVHFLPLKPRPIEESPKSRKKPFWILRIEETGSRERVLHMNEHPLDFFLGRQLKLGGGIAFGKACGHPKLVGEHLDRAA